MDDIHLAVFEHFLEGGKFVLVDSTIDFVYVMVSEVLKGLLRGVKIGRQVVPVPWVADDFPKRGHDVVVSDEDDVGLVMTYKPELLETLADEKALDGDADECGDIIDDDGVECRVGYTEDADESEGQNGMEKYGTGYPGDDEFGTYEVFMGYDVKGIDADEVTDVENKPIGKFVVKEYGIVMYELFNVIIKDHEEVDGEYINCL